MEKEMFFMHRCDFRNDARCLSLRAKYPKNGYGVLVLLMEMLVPHGIKSLVIDDSEIQQLSDEFQVDKEELKGIIDYCIELNLLGFNEETLSIVYNG